MTQLAIDSAGANNSTRSSSSNTSKSNVTGKVPYYGSREPKQSNSETDRVIFQMMDNLQGNKTQLKESSIYLEEEEEGEHIEPSTKPIRHGVLWRFRIVLSSIIILLLVVATVVISELSKRRS